MAESSDSVSRSSTAPQPHPHAHAHADSPSPLIGIELFSHVTTHSPDSIVSIPSNSSTPLIAVGGYELLDAATQLKGGSITLMAIESADSNDSMKIVEKSSIPTDAIFSLNHHSSRLWSCDSSGLVESRSVQNNEIDKNSSWNWNWNSGPAANSSFPSESALSMSFSSLNNHFTVSGSNGRVSLLDSAIGAEVTSWRLHTLECWTSRVDSTEFPSVIFSGSDDNLLLGIDIRQSTRNLSEAAFCSRVHGAGVTAIEFPATGGLLTGSYDERLRFLDSRKISVAAGEIRISGSGVWKIEKFENEKLDKTRQFLAISGMYAGAHIVNFSASSNTFNHFAQYLGHNSMVYGNSNISSCNQFPLFVSCSFYDKLLKGWKIEPKSIESEETKAL